MDKIGNRPHLDHNLLDPEGRGLSMGNKKIIGFVLGACVILWTTAASAVEVRYQINFADSLFGTGQLTLDEEPESTDIGGTSVYDFSDVSGLGTAGAWLGGFFRYNPTSGVSAFQISVDGTMATFEDGEPGLNPLEGFEVLLDEAQASGFLNWTRLTPFPPTVPDGGLTLAMLGIALVGIAAGRRVWR